MKGKKYTTWDDLDAAAQLYGNRLMRNRLTTFIRDAKTIGLRPGKRSVSNIVAMMPTLTRLMKAGNFQRIQFVLDVTSNLRYRQVYDVVRFI